MRSSGSLQAVDIAEVLAAIRSCSGWLARYVHRESKNARQAQAYILDALTRCSNAIRACAS